MPDAATIRVSVVYAGPQRVFRAEVELPKGSTVAEAIARSRIRESRPDVDIHPDRVGVFARKAALATPLRDGDRVEIYRPLALDPKEARRRRARKG
ncbi:MAG: RnfH family protein [Rhodanobacteraceae bacterium]|nr:MAG: RnfH family protein [Rhodanobacteraceae bacterium]